MRKSQKNQILDTLVLLDQAHTAVKAAIETKNQDAALTLLEQCQDSAIQIGGMIEKSEGEGFVTVGLLEHYCEQLYQTFELIRQEQPLFAGKIYKSLRKDLIRIENSVKNDIYVRTSVVFLPYKASMWDSLESVWRAADADPECDAYVMPIPYFDKNPDGSFREMHDEGDQYPNDVPVVSWEEYDLAAEHPDLIYIHNPYDECNHVTSVHPAFYARELRNYTDKLVYIPYFILNEIDPDDQAAIEGMKHFCFLPGTLYANQVIVQSENMRQIYINEYIKAAKEMELGGEHIDRKFLEKKFLGTGSPKIDKVLNTKKEDLEIPAEWRKIIEKPDGSRKKIVFYNTSVSALLHDEEKMLRKMESVFEIFKENRDEVVLLWRPHPLIQATIASMRPQLWAAYKEIRDRYIAEGWGIYDDSADMDRAVVMSDAYYGVGSSSVVQLYRKMQKPILIQNVDCLDENGDQFFLSSYVCCFWQDRVVLVSQATNAVIVLFKLDWTVENIYVMEDEKFAETLSLAVFCRENQLVSIPYYAENFNVVNLLTGEQKKIEGCISGVEKGVREKFITSIVCGRRAWIIGENIKRIIGIDMESLEVFADIAFSDIKDLKGIADSIVWGTAYVIIENRIFLASRNYGIILCIDNLTNRITVCTRLENEGFSYFYEYNDMMFLIDQSGCEYLYDADKFTVTGTGRQFKDACWKCVAVGQKRYYFEAFSGKINCLNENNEREIIYESGQDLTQVGVKFQFVENNGDYIYFQERFSGQIFVLDTTTEQCVKLTIDVSKYIESWRKKTIEQSACESANLYLENGAFSVGNLLHYLNDYA